MLIIYSILSLNINSLDDFGIYCYDLGVLIKSPLSLLSKFFNILFYDESLY
jgi:hypothetical protein